jgi:hypothetical protein
MNGGTVVARNPALRGQVDCIVVPKDLIFNANVTSGPTLYTNITSPTGCSNASIIGQYNAYIISTINVPVTGYFASTFDLPVYGSSCPPLVVFYGVMINNYTEYFMALLYTSFVERLEFNATFNLPHLSIVSPPQILPNTSSYFSSWYPSVMSDDFQTINISSSTNLFDNFVSYPVLQDPLLTLGAFSHSRCTVHEVVAFWSIYQMGSFENASTTRAATFHIDLLLGGTQPS